MEFKKNFFLLRSITWLAVHAWCGINGIISDVQEMERVRERVAVLLNGVAQCSGKIWVC